MLSLNVKTVQFQTIQFSISTQFSSIRPIYRTLPGAIIPRPRSDGDEGVLRIPQSSSITGTPPSDCLVSYQDTRWTGILPICRGAVGVFLCPIR